MGWQAMHEEEHKITVTATKCGREGCECEDEPDTYTGTIEEVLQAISDESFDRDEYILDALAEQAELIARLYQIVELMATLGYQVEFVAPVENDDLDFGNGKLN